MVTRPFFYRMFVLTMGALGANLKPTILLNVMQNLRCAARMLRKSPIFAAIALLSLAFSIGANTAIFTMINAVLLQTLPVRGPEGLV